MTQAKITLNGTIGSNTDLPIGTPVACNNVNNGGELTYLWVVDYQPAGTADNFSNPIIQNPTFTPNKEDTYKITLIVNQGLPDEKRDSVVIGIRRLKTRIRVPAATETTQADLLAGWAGDTNLTLDLIDTMRADPGVFVAQLSGSGLSTTSAVQVSGTATIKNGLPGQENVPVVSPVDATSSAAFGSLGMIVGAVDGGAISSGKLAFVRRFGRQVATVAGAIGAALFISNTGTLSTSPGTNRRFVGRIASATEVYFDGSSADNPSGIATALPLTGDVNGLASANHVDKLTPASTSLNLYDAGAVVRGSWETTHGRLTAGGAGGEFKTVIGGLVGAEGAASAIWFITGLTAPTGSNFAIYATGTDLLFNVNSGTGTFHFQAQHAVDYAVLSPSTWTWDATAAAPTFTQVASSTGNGVATLIKAQSSTFAGGNGGQLTLQSGTSQIGQYSGIRALSTSIFIDAAGASAVEFTAAAMFSYMNQWAWFDFVTAPNITVTARTTNAATNVLTIKGQDAFSGATAGQQAGADIFIQPGAPTLNATAVPGNIHVSLPSNGSPYRGLFWVEDVANGAIFSVGVDATYGQHNLWLAGAAVPGTAQNSNAALIGIGTATTILNAATQVNFQIAGSAAGTNVGYYTSTQWNIGNQSTVASVILSAVSYVQVASPTLQLTGPNLQWTALAGAPLISQQSNASNIANNDMTLAPQAPWNNVANTFNTPGSLVVNLAAPTNAATTEAAFNVKRNNVSIARIKQYDGQASTAEFVLGATATNAQYAIYNDSVNNNHFNSPLSTLYFEIAGAQQSYMQSGLWHMSSTNKVEFDATLSGASAPWIYQATPGGNVLPQPFKISAQAPYSAATGANQNPGNLIFEIPKSLSANAFMGGVLVQQADPTTPTPMIRMGMYGGPDTTYAAIWFRDGGSPGSGNFGFLGNQTVTYLSNPVSISIVIGGTAGNGFSLTGTSSQQVLCGTAVSTAQWGTNKPAAVYNIAGGQAVTVLSLTAPGSSAGTGNLQITGSIQTTWRNSAASFTIDTTTNDHAIRLTATQNVTLANIAIGRELDFIMDATGVAVGSNMTITFVRVAAERINNVAASYIVSVPGGDVQGYRVKCDGTNWWIYPG